MGFNNQATLAVVIVRCSTQYTTDVQIFFHGSLIEFLVAFTSVA
jgi:hypothetical protein